MPVASQALAKYLNSWGLKPQRATSIALFLSRLWNKFLFILVSLLGTFITFLKLVRVSRSHSSCGAQKAAACIFLGNWTLYWSSYKGKLKWIKWILLSATHRCTKRKKLLLPGHLPSNEIVTQTELEPLVGQHLWQSYCGYSQDNSIRSWKIGEYSAIAAQHKSTFTDSKISFSCKFFSLEAWTLAQFINFDSVVILIQLDDAKMQGALFNSTSHAFKPSPIRCKQWARLFRESFFYCKNKNAFVQDRAESITKPKFRSPEPMFVRCIWLPNCRSITLISYWNPCCASVDAFSFSFDMIITDEEQPVRACCRRNKEYLQTLMESH